MRGIEEAKLSKSTLMELSLLDPIYPSERRAVVAVNPAILGMGQMFALLTGIDQVKNFRMFTEYELAMQWVSEPPRNPTV